MGRALKLILLGSPGVGKGTYTQDLVHLLHLVHVSTGDLFRENITKGTSLGKKAKEYIDAGQLVPDDVTIGMVKDRLEFHRLDDPTASLNDAAKHIASLIGKSWQSVKAAYLDTYKSSPRLLASH